MLNKQEVAALIKQKFNLKVDLLPAGDCEYKVDLLTLLPLCRELKAAGYGFLADITAVDYLAEGYFRLLYQVCNYQNGDTITLKVDVSREEPLVESVCPVWAAANWLEREVYDMFGIVFKNHPKLERILLWEGFEGWPLRKDYVHQPSKYQGRRRLD